ncbi:hypothetical protein O5559_28025, partial [Escherichia coli]|nr:hypothetical protein [Escherichia coli]
MSSKLVLVLNCGSTSLKFAIIDAVNGEEYLSGLDHTVRRGAKRRRSHHRGASGGSG